MDSSFRVRAFNSTNKLEAFTPIQDSIEYSGSFKYYWFLSTAAAESSDPASVYWQHQIAVGIKDLGADVDMYVSVMDGRFPVEEDYDFYSANQGPDMVTISANDTIF